MKGRLRFFVLFYRFCIREIYIVEDEFVDSVWI